MRAALIVIAALAALAALEMTAAADPTAEDHFNAGQQAYDRGDFSAAIGEWQAAYQLSGEIGLLFNLAQAYRLNGDCTSALSTYKKFVTGNSTDPTSEQHKLALDLARELEPKCGVRPAPIVEQYALIVERVVPITVSIIDQSNEHGRERSGRALKVAGLVTGGAGIASIAIGLGLGHHAQVLADEVTSACAVSCNWAVQKSKDADGRRDAAIGRALDVAGVAGIAGGAVLYYLGVRQGTITVSPRSREGGAVVSWSGSW